MGKFLEEEKPHQTKFKETSEYFTEAAKPNGIYRRKPRSFCLPLDHAEENLFSEIRTEALEYFHKNNIKWHDGQSGKPSHHLCSSMVQCVNFLYPFADKPEALCTLLRPVVPEIQSVIPMESDGRFVSFEWIGCKNYLKEKTRGGGSRTRGAYFTSADAAVMCNLADGTRQIMLIEWKYTESYGRTWLGVSKNGTNRMDIYRHLYERPDFPLDKTLLSDFCHLFYEPFYQFFRQQSLAHQMELAQELESNLVTVLHVAPARNRDFHRVTSPGLQPLGGSSIEVWKKLVKQPARFISVTTEELFGNLDLGAHQGLAPWWQYISERYPWLQSRDVE